MAKPEEFPKGLQTGRIWGIWNAELLPIQWETAQVEGIAELLRQGDRS
jgi:hypothetical protein